MCSAEDWCSECSHLSLLQFQAFVKDAEKRSAKEKKRAKSSGGSSEHSCRQEPASEAPWASSFVIVESDLAAIKASIAELLVVLLPPASGSGFSGWRSECASAPWFVLGVRGPWSPLGSDPSVVAGSSRTLAAVEQRELVSSQRSLVSQIVCGLASKARDIRAKAGHAVGSRHNVSVAPPSVPPRPAPLVSGFFRSRGFFRGRSRGHRGFR
ncbi:hypothetical protein E2C01_054476 [Portunus trituberculatus]|uniref:Uncharacterized protein n=1 Tax=Portunus trituberculatus TaxID=210409 RepID=A0A5B7GNS1_PORTR|nr:hypothetical protein [Portunus trituberculatus]